MVLLRRVSGTADTPTRRAVWPLAVALALYLAMLCVVAWIGYRRTEFHLTYALDDAYIHMAIAKNLARHGVLGVTPFEFTSASSSPLWTIMLALVYKLTGVHDATPLVLNVAVGAALVVLTDKVLRIFGAADITRFLGMVWMVFATPLAPIVFGGMEHPLQVLLDLGFVALAARLLERETAEWDGPTGALVVLAAGVAGVRYEGLALVGIVAALLAVRRRWSQALAVVGAGVAPLVVYGLVSVAQGAFFLPNSVYVKASTGAGIATLFSNPSAFVHRFVELLPTTHPLLPLIVGSALFLVVQLSRGRGWWHARVIFPCIAIAVSCIHLVVGDVGWFFRYEDYMVALLGLGLLLQLTDVLEATPAETVLQWAVLSLAVVVALTGVFACARRGNTALRSTPWAVKNVYEQMYQMAHFLKANPQYESVVIGDLGAISYYNDDLRILDLEGLALRDVPMRYLGKDRLDAETIDRLADRNGAQIAVIFTDYFDQPAQWELAGTWTIRNNLVAGGDTVAFLAVPPTDVGELRTALKRYSSERLPEAVEVDFP